ncbi:TonB-dependent receptor [Novosphingobium humi]|uniref:TonB-dependent receptor n=1 Tax=Novosphingobium humi TaxID=2282397 RepID=A0ABY7U2R0_9SPHN|nr:TonB-dependent receptor [Novosphingobium humi]WCT79508.1 TonB-dependent receptor [Novosphingobium humi]
MILRPPAPFPASRLLLLLLLLAGVCTMAIAAPASAEEDRTIIVTASRSEMLGKAETASQGSISQTEVALRPIYRAAQLFESIPGLVVTTHSGEGKAPYYLIRGYALDHGTDFANFIDDMPVNRGTNAHGQGYSDLGFLMPQTVAGIDYTKGPYYAGVGDFGSVASARTRLLNEAPAQIAATVGTDGYQEVQGIGTLRLGQQQRLLGAFQLSHYDGPWQPGQNFRKVNAMLRYSQGTAQDGFTLTAMAYASEGRLSTDQPQRAVEAGLIGRYGTLDPSDYSRSQRYSLSAHIEKPLGAGQFAASLYAIRSTMTLWNNFTHYLYDPVNGDQQAQHEARTVLGGRASYALKAPVLGLNTETVWGAQVRYDSALVDRRHTRGRDTILPDCFAKQEDGSILNYNAVNGNCNADRVHILMLSPYVQTTLRWTDWLRTVGGIRLDYTRADDVSHVTGTSGRGHQFLWQPKASLILGPWAKTEFYFSAGRGFHSNDVRGVFGTVPTQGVPLAAGGTPLLASTTGMEVGMRSNIIARLSLQMAAFQQDFGSELRYNADTGQNEAGAPSRRQGIEISAQYRPVHWLELNSDLAFARPRYRGANLAAFGIAQPYIADAPNFTYSAGALVNGLGPWSGSLQWRRLGTHSLADGQLDPRDGGYSEWNIDVTYALAGGWKAQVSLFNIFNSRSDSATYYYTSRLLGEPAEGVEGYHAHPLEPRSARFTIRREF